jgi:hypothetical protein
LTNLASLTAAPAGSSDHSHAALYMYKVPLYTTSSNEDDNIMMHARYKVHVSPNSLSSQHSTKSSKYDSCARVSLHKGTPQAVLPEPHRGMPDPAASTDQVRLYKDYLKVDKYEYVKPHAKSHMKQNTEVVPSSGSSHKMINTKDYLKVDKYEDSHVKPPVKSNMKQNTDDVPTRQSPPRTT